MLCHQNSVAPVPHTTGTGYSMGAITGHTRKAYSATICQCAPLTRRSPGMEPCGVQARFHACRCSGWIYPCPLAGVDNADHMRLKGATIVILAVVVAAIAAGVIMAPGAVGRRVLSTDEGNGYSASRLGRGQIVDIAYFFQNRSGDRTLTVRGVTLSHPLPAHLELVHTSITPLGPRGDTFTFLTGFPPHDPGRIVPRPVDGYLLRPHGAAEVILSVRSHVPGRFAIHGVTLHADLPFLFTAIPVEITNQACTAFGVAVSLSGPGWPLCQ